MSQEWERCWIIGAGLLGSALATLCHANNRRVLTLDKQAPADVVGDAADADVLGRAKAHLEPEVVFLCQATQGGTAEEYKSAYIHVAEQVLSSVPQAKVVLCSSTSVYGSVSGAVDEKTLPVSPTEKAQILLQTEQMVLERGGAVARLAPLYAPGRCELLRRHMAGEPRLAGPDTRMLNYVHAEDAAQALFLLSAASGVYHVCGESLSLGDAYRMLEQESGVARSVEIAAAGRRGLSDRRIDFSRMLTLGWQPRHTLASFIREQLKP